MVQRLCLPLSHTSGTVAVSALPHTSGTVAVSALPHTSGTVAVSALPHTSSTVAVSALPHTSGTVAVSALSHTSGTVAVSLYLPLPCSAWHHCVALQNPVPLVLVWYKSDAQFLRDSRKKLFKCMAKCILNLNVH